MVSKLHEPFLIIKKAFIKNLISSQNVQTNAALPKSFELDGLLGLGFSLECSRYAAASSSTRR